MASEARGENISWVRGFRRAGAIPAVGFSLVALLLVWLGINLVQTPSDFASVALEGLTLGLVYGLIALGYSLVYGILELINFAHGDVFMLGPEWNPEMARHGAIVRQRVAPRRLFARHHERNAPQRQFLGR